MAAEIGDRPVARPRIEAPGAHQRVGVEHVVLEVVPPKAEHLADLAAVDDLLRQRGDRVLQVVEPDHGLHAGRLGREDQGARLGGGRRERLLAIDVLAGLDGGHCHVAVQEVRRRDVDQINGRIRYELAPVAGRAGEAQLPPRRLRRVDVGQQRELRFGGEVEDRCRRAVRDCVGTAHIATADEPDAESAFVVHPNSMDTWLDTGALLRENSTGFSAGLDSASAGSCVKPFAQRGRYPPRMGRRCTMAPCRTRLPCTGILSSVHERVFDVWRSPGRFTKNPDVVQLRDGRLMLVYSDTDQHWSMEDQVITTLVSDDHDSTWRKHREVDAARLADGDERLVTPRLSRLSDGRLAIIVDRNNDGHFHEDQPSGNLIYWSHDDGASWEKPDSTGIIGFEPDRIVELPDGRLGVGSHLLRGDTQEYAEILSTSSDDGATWQETATVANDGVHRFCEGAMVPLGGQRMACVLRESRSGGMPSFVAFSEDAGRSWGPPQMCPLSLHRPFAGLLPDGRMLVTGRNVLDGVGTYAWVGHLEAETGYQIGGPRGVHRVSLHGDALTITNGPTDGCRYVLQPPESSLSRVAFEAVLRVDGGSDAVAFVAVSRLNYKRGNGVVVRIGRKHLTLGPYRRNVDFSRFRRVKVTHERGLLQVRVDDELLVSGYVWREDLALSVASREGPLHGRTQFGELGAEGSSHWRHVAYELDNPSGRSYRWRWDAESGRLPDDYQRQRLIQIHANDATAKQPDHGDSSWLRLADGRIFLVDYTTPGDPPGKSHLIGVHLRPEDLAEHAPD